MLRLEFELDEIPKALTVTAAALSGGYENRPWQLESVTEAGGGGQAGFASAQVIRGLGGLQVGKLEDFRDGALRKPSSKKTSMHLDDKRINQAAIAMRQLIGDVKIRPRSADPKQRLFALPLYASFRF